MSIPLTRTSRPRIEPRGPGPASLSIVPAADGQIGPAPAQQPESATITVSVSVRLPSARESTVDLAEVARALRELARRFESDGADRQVAARPAGFDIDIAARRVRIGDRDLDLTYLEFELLAYLARNAGRAVSRDELMRNVWGVPTLHGGRTVDVHIRRIRAKLAEHGAIETVRGYGYRCTR